MKHIDENDLTLYQYQEPVDRAAIEAHLAECASCRAEKANLEFVLAAVDGSPVPERDDTYGEQVWHRLQPHLAAKPAPRQRFSWDWAFPWQRWALGGAVAALVALAFVAGRFWPRHEKPVETAISAQARDRILLAAVADHVERSQILLLALANSEETGGDRKVDISWEQEQAQQLVAGNRIYQETAERLGEPGLSSVLDDLGRVLLTVAHSPSSVSPEELDELRRRIESQGMLFKMQVVDSQLQARVKAANRRQSQNSL
ncbi:MAG TPA: zf-HC2 domain-containing protein [Terriglobia bacterium]|nr:zf-HC2 domain-containing protein [Terriglobia bacterium]